MNIANIFGLHIGCKVKCKGQKKTGFVIRVLPDYEDTRKWEIGVQFWNEKKTWNTIHDISITECKLILKPLSKITDEDKAEFMEKFYPTDSLFWRYMRIVSFQASGLGVYSTRREESYSVAYTYQQALFLSTKGYKIEGIVPDEYKEVEE